MSEDGSAETLHAGIENDTNNYHIPAKDMNSPEEEYKTGDPSKESLAPSDETRESCVDYSKTSLDITVHQATGNIVVKVVSDDDGKVIQEILFEKLFFQDAKHDEIEGLLAYKTF